MDIINGQYINNNCILKRVNIVIRMYYLILMCILVFVFKDFGLQGILAGITVLVSAFSGLKPGVICKRIRKPVYMIILLALFQLIFAAGEEMVLEYGIFHIYKEGINATILIAIRLLIIGINSVIIFSTATPLELIHGMERGFFLKGEYAMSMIIAFSFLPILSDEYNKIRLSQADRGIDINYGSLWTKIRNAVAIIIPLFRKALNKSQVIADNLDVRCYNSDEKRTSIYS